MDIDNNSRFYELADEVIQVPLKEEITVRDPEIYMKRLKEITTPREQMKEFIFSTFNVFQVDSTHEGRWARDVFMTGVGVGWIFGGLIDSKHLHNEYARQHNASVFDSHYKAKRHTHDTFLLKIISRGMPYAFKTGLLCLSAGILSFGSITYRSKLFYPDWALSFATLGAISRLWLGSRGLVAGAGFGLIAGTFGYSVARVAELASGMSVAEFRYHQEMEFARKRQAQLDRLHRQREGWLKDQASPT